MDETTKAFLNELAEALRADLAEQCKKMDAKIDAITDSVREHAGERDRGVDGTMAVRTAADSVPRAEFAALASSVAKLKQQGRPMANLAAFEDVQTKADAVLREHGERASPQMPGEDIVNYAIRLHRPMQKFSPKWKSVDLGIISADRKALDNLLAEIRADAIQAARNPTGLPEGQHKMITRQMPGGHIATEFYGTGTIFKQLARPVRRVAYIGPRNGAQPRPY
jgi:hypothetical protein